MEKPNTHFSITQLLASIKRLAGRSMDPDVAWRMMFLFAFCSALALAAFAYLTYTWATSAAIPPPTSKTEDRGAFSVSELKAVLDTYRAKEATYNQLMHTRPTAPAYFRVKEASAPTATST